MTSMRRETALLLAGDLILLTASLWLALFVRTFVPPGVGYFGAHLEVFVFVFLISVLVFFVAGLYERQARLVKTDIATRVLGAQIANTIVAGILFFVLPGSLEPKTILGLYLVISVLLVSAWRFFIVPLVSMREKEKAVLVATGDEARELVAELNDNRKRYYVEITEFIDTALSPAEEIRNRMREAIQGGVTLVILDETARTKEGFYSLYGSALKKLTLVDFTSFYEDIFDRVPLGKIDDVWLLEHLPRRRVMYDLTKLLIERLAGVIGLILSLAFIVPAVLILMSQGGRPFITHERIGKGGRCFKIVKLRTMLFDDHGDPELQKKNHVTGFGKFLRRSRIDELPQFLNICKGELSFVGPRPELPVLAEVYEREIPNYGLRHLVAPGLSGWAQIWDPDPPKGGVDIGRTRRKLSFDLYYVKHRAPWVDMAISLKTLRALLSFSGT